MILWLMFAIVSAAVVFAVLAPFRKISRNAPARSEAEIYRDQLAEIDDEVERGVLTGDTAEAARTEISRRLIAAAEADEAGADARPHAGAGDGSGRLRMIAAGAATLGIPAFALALYLSLGSPSLPGQPFAARSGQQGETASEDIRALILKVEAHLKDNPGDVRGWEVLAPVYGRLGRHGEAARAYGRVLALKGRSAGSLGDYGEALVMADDGLVRQEARQAFSEAAKMDPSLPKPQFYLGLADEQDGDVKQAATRWRALLQKTPADAPWRAALEGRLRKVTGAGGDTAIAPPLSQEQLEAARGMDGGARREMVRQMVARLEQRLKSEGGAVEDWLRLARSHMVLGQSDAAGRALAAARAHFKDDEKALAQLNAAAATLPKAPALSKEQMQAARGMDDGARREMIGQMVARLETRLNSEGGNVEDWLRLVRSHMVLGQGAAAREALSAARAQFKGDARAQSRFDAIAEAVSQAPEQDAGSAKPEKALK